MVKVVDSIEKNIRVFKKPQENREEEYKFYNEGYFTKIGFPDAKVYEGEMSEDGTMKGGYYKHPEILTHPFRQFVEIVQNKGYNKPDESDNSIEEPVIPDGYKEVVEYKAPNKDNESRGFFDRLGEYGDQINRVVDSTKSKLSPYFKSNSTEIINNDKMESSENKPESEPGKKKYWIVRIPIVEDEDIAPKGEYEKAEIKMNQILLEEKIDKEIGKLKEGTMYEVGSRYVRMCEGVLEWERSELESIKLTGSRMSKMTKMRKK